MGKYKKVFLILIFLLVVFLIGFFIYNTFFRQTTTTQVPGPGTDEQATTTQPGKLTGADTGDGVIIEDGGEGTEETVTGIPKGQGKNTIEVDDKAKGGLTKTTAINNSRSLSPSLSDGKNIQYYNKDDGKFYRIGEDGTVTLMSDKVFYNVENVNWSPVEDKAVIEYPDGSNIVYDFESQKQISLPKHWEDFEFSSGGDKLTMKSIGLDPNNRWLAISNVDGSRSQAIEQIGENEDTVYPSWSPNNQSIAMYTKGVDFDRQEVFFVGLNKENFKSTIIEGHGFQPKWSTEGDKLLYSVYSTTNNLKPKLWIVNAEGNNIGSGRKSIGLETWAEKCTFANNNEVYCAVPETLEEGAGLFPELAQNTKDRLYKIDINTGLKKLIAVPDQTFNMSNLIVSDNGENLYFTDKINEVIYKIELE